MKTKTVELYIDLQQGWQDLDPDRCYLTATSRVYAAEPYPDMVRVKIVVELPELPYAPKVDHTVKAESSLVTLG